MYKTTVTIGAFCIFITIVSGHFRERRSGISDQRLAELQTLLALSNHGHGEVAYGILDPSIIGKRKRSYNYDAMDDEFPLDWLRDSRLKHLSNREKAIAYLQRMYDNIFRSRENELDSPDLQSNDEIKK